MADRSLRGARLGSSSLQSEEGVVLAQRQRVRYECANCGTETELVFSAEVAAPDHWECRSCGQLATRAGGDVAAAEPPPTPASGRTPWEMLRERRSIPELEEILQERLEWLRARRGEDHAA